MDRRTALSRIGLASSGVATGILVTSSPVFADGGSGNCRSTPALGSTLTSAGPTSGKDNARVFTSRTSFAAAACGCGWTASVQRKWSVIGPAASGVYSAASGGALLSGGFGPAGASVSVPGTVYVRHTGAGNLNGQYTVDLTVRHVCRSGSQVAWSCQRYRWVFSQLQSGGSTGTFTAISTATIGPPDNGAFCDSPTP